MAISKTVEIRYGTASSYFDFTNLPTPYVSRSQEVIYAGKKYGQKTNITLKGSVIGSYDDDSHTRGNLNTLQIYSDINRIIDGFSTDFQTLYIIEDGTTQASFQGCTVNSLDFSAFNYGKSEYTINLTSYDASTFYGYTYGVLEPKSEVSFGEEQNGFITINQRVSAKGFTVSGTSNATALTNAVAFVDSRTGYSTSAVIPTFMASISDANLLTTNIEKSINRSEGSYSASIDYLVQTQAVGEISPVAATCSTINTAYSSGITDDFATIDIDYTIKASKYAANSDLRSVVPSVSTLYIIATGNFPNGSYLNPTPTDLSIDDSSDVRKEIKISTTFDNDPMGSYVEFPSGVYFDYSVTVDTDDITDRTTVSIDGTLKSRGSWGHIYDSVSGAYMSITQSSAGLTGYLFARAYEFYTGVNYNFVYGDTYWNLNPFPKDANGSIDEIKGEISLNASFDNENYKMGFKNTDWTVDVTPQLRKYIAKPSCNANGRYFLFDINSANREVVNMNGNMEIDSDYWYYSVANWPSNYQSAVHDYATYLQSQFVAGSDPVLVDESIEITPSPNLSASIKQSFSSINGPDFY